MKFILRRWPLLVSFVLGALCTFPLWSDRVGNPHGTISIAVRGVYPTHEDTGAYNTPPVGPKVHCTMVIVVGNHSNLTAKLNALELTPSLSGTQIELPAFKFDSGSIWPGYYKQTEAKVSLDPNVCRSL